MTSILIANNLVEDFVGIASETSTRVHVGEKEAFRLLGEKPENGPLVSFLRPCLASEISDLISIHIRDWHPKGDPEFDRYGEHCVAGSDGARFVWDRWLSLPENGRHFLIHSGRLNLFAEGILPGLLRFLLHREDASSVRFGVIGVTTNIKIFNICEGLMDYLEARQVAVCSELTASTSVQNHFKGLDDLESRLGVKILERVVEFRKWLSVTEDTQPRIHRPHYDAPSITSPVELAPGERQILERLCHGSKSGSLEPLRGGYSGSRLFLLDRKDREGRVLAKGVAKIDAPEKITRERRGHLLAKDILGPNVPEVIAFAYEEDLAGVLLSLAGIRRPPLRTLQSVAMSLDGSPEAMVELEEIWDEVLGVLANLYFPGREERLNLYSHNTFQEKYSQRTLDRFSTLLSWPGSEEGRSFQEWGLELKHPRLFYEGVLPRALKSPASYVTCGVAHGDLNGANILLDKVKNVWIIDFFHTHENHHLLQDLTKLENDLKFLMTPLSSDEDLKALVRMERLLNKQDSLAEPLPAVAPFPSRIRKTYNSIRRLREFASQTTRDPDLGNYRIPLLRYAAHTMGFDECTLLQKKAAAVSVALLCEKLSP